MFSQKKSFLKGKLFYMILLGLLVFGYWINQAPADMKSQDQVNTDSNFPVNEENTDTSGKNDSNSEDIMNNIIGGNVDSTNSGINSNNTVSGSSLEQQSKCYYLVKEINGTIKIFYYDENGKEKLIRSTDIAFSLLSVNDQVLFQKGIIKHTAEELEELLQDFES